MDIADDFGREPNTRDFRLLVLFPSASDTAFPASKESLNPKLNVVPHLGKLLD